VEQMLFFYHQVFFNVSWLPYSCHHFSCVWTYMLGLFEKDCAYVEVIHYLTCMWLVNPPHLFLNSNPLSPLSQPNAPETEYTPRSIIFIFIISFLSLTYLSHHHWVPAHSPSSPITEFHAKGTSIANQLHHLHRPPHLQIKDRDWRAFKYKSPLAGSKKEG